MQKARSRATEKPGASGEAGGNLISLSFALCQVSSVQELVENLGPEKGQGRLPPLPLSGMGQP